MKLRNLFLAVLAGVAFFATSCSQKEEDLGAAGIKTDKSELSFSAESSTQNITLTATRDWSYSVSYDTDEKWISVSPSSGKASSKSQTVEVTALANSGYDRTATIKFTIGLADALVTVSQKGSKVKTYKTLADVRTYCEANGVNADSDIALPDDYIVKAWFISNQTVLDNLNSNKSSYVQDETDGINVYFSANNEFEFGDVVEIDLSNANMKLYGGVLEVDGLAVESVTKTGTTTPQPKTVSMADYLENKYESQYITIDAPVQTKSSSTQTWYSGTSTASSVYFTDASGNEFQVRSSKYSTYGAENVPTGSGKISGIASYYNGSAQLVFAQASDYAGLTGERFTVKGQDHSSATAVTVKDFISKADKNTYYKLTGTVSSFNATYCSFNLTDETGTIYVYSVDNKDEWSSKIKNGGTVTLAGKYDYYSTKSQHEVINAQIISFEEGSSEPEEDYTKAEALTVKAFIDKADANTYYKLTGTVSGFSSTYCSFDLTDETGTIYVYSVDNKSDWVDKISNGGTVTLAGKYLYYSAKSQNEVVNAQILSFEAGEDTPSGDVADPKEVSIREFLAAEESNTQPYKLTGTVCGSINTTYGNFDLTDGADTVYVYGLTKTNLGYGASNDKSYASLGINSGDEVTLIGFRGSFNGKKEVLYSYYVSHKSSGGSGDSGDDSGSGDSGATDASLTPGENEVLYLLSNDEISAVTKDASVSGTVYGTHEITSAAGKWSGNFAVSASNTFLQIRNNNASYLTSPEYSTKVLRVVLVSTASKYNNSTDYTRNIYAVPTVDASKLPTGKDSSNKNITYTETEWSSNYGSAKFTSKGGAQNAEIKFNAETKKFSIISADGAIYIDAIYVFCAK